MNLKIHGIWFFSEKVSLFETYPPLHSDWYMYYFAQNQSPLGVYVKKQNQVEALKPKESDHKRNLNFNDPDPKQEKIYMYLLI